MVSFTKTDDCIWFSHLSPDLQGRLSHLSELEPVSLRLNGQRTIWCRMRTGLLLEFGLQRALVSGDPILLRVVRQSISAHARKSAPPPMCLGAATE